jgi:hypothetical protein
MTNVRNEVFIRLLGQRFDCIVFLFSRGEPFSPADESVKDSFFFHGSFAINQNSIKVLIKNTMLK